MKEKENIALYNCISRLTGHIRNIDELEKAMHVRNGSYPYIPFYFPEFVKIVNLLREKITFDTPSFIDYGCGVGITIEYARSIGFKATGVEYNEKFRSHNIEIEDLKTYQFKDKYFDIVYFYSPFTNEDFEVEFEIKALNSVKKGGYVICPPPGRAISFKSARSDYYSKKHSQLFKLLNDFEFVKENIYPILKRIK